MPSLAATTKPFSRVKAFFTRKRAAPRPVSPDCQPSGSDQPSVGQTHAHTNRPHPSAALVTPQPFIIAAHDSIPVTKSIRPSAVPSSAEVSSPPALSVSIGDGQPLLADDGKVPWQSRGFAAFKSALEVTKNFAQPFPPVAYAAAALLIVMEGFEKVEEAQEDFAYVAQKLAFMRTTYEEHWSQLKASESIKASMGSLALAMRIVERMVQAKSNRSLFKQIWENPNDVKAVAAAVRMLGDVVDQFIMSVTASTHSMLFEGLQDLVLDKLAFADSAQFLSIENGRMCTEGTRAEFLADLLAWAMTADQPCIYWLNGAAGSGKTTIAYTLCGFLRGLGLLGGSFFCSRDADDKRRSTKFIFSSLARSLAYHDGVYARSLAQVLKEPGAGSVIATEQLTNLIAAPIRSIRLSENSSPGPIRVFVIDALDECTDDYKRVYDIIRRLLIETRGLGLKFLITSRPEPHIIRAFGNAEQGGHLVRDVGSIPDDVAKTDIMTYLESELKECAHSHGISDDWPPASQVRALAKQAGTLFIYASTACKYIWNFGEDPVKRLAGLTAIDAQPLRGIDPMYEFVLDQVRQSKDPGTWAVTRRCVQAIARLSRPLSLGDLGDLLNVDHREVSTALAGLQSVLYIPPSDTSDAITVFHASFSDYVLDVNRSGERDWFLESAAVHQDLLRRCIAIMKLNLRFNISNSTTSYLSNGNQPLKPTLSGSLRYSCLHWIEHLESCGSLAISELPELSELLTGRFLYWLEVLSIVGEVQRAPIVMTRLLNWLHTSAAVPGASNGPSQVNDRATGRTSDDLRKFARDARDFVNRFAQPIAESCPHIYLSALAATTKASTVWAKILPMFKGLPNIITQQVPDTCPIFVLYGHRGDVNSIAFSPDGMRIVSGSDDCTLRLWDAATGAVIGDPLRGHTNRVSAVAFSPNGTRVISGSWDCTIQLWDAATGAAIGDPFCGHEDIISSVAFSPDGSRIASGSSDRTIRLWNAATGTAIGDPFRGHEYTVRSVAFSLDVTRVISGSDDGIIRLWDAATGAAIGDPFRGQTGWVESVAFSPDGTRVVSGGDDGAIRLWDIAAGATIGEPLRGHEGLISSVAFSPDGTRVVSGSADCTIRLWDAATGTVIGDPFRGHRGDIHSVAFSPEGSRVVSGSWDCTIRLWDTAPGATIGNPLHHRQRPIYSVAFSPNGTRAVSGSNDHTIRLWDVATGATIGQPLRGHEGLVRSLAFSPDGTRLASGSHDLTIRLWDVATGVAIGDPLRGHKNVIWSVAFSPDGTRVISGSDDCTIRLWDAATGAAIGDPLRGHVDWVRSLAFSPDGARIVSGSYDSTVQFWDAATGATIGDPIHGHQGSIHSVAFSPNGMSIASGSWDRTIQLWDAATGAAIGNPFRGHEDIVSFVTFSPDGSRVVSGSFDGTIRLWDATTGTPIGNPLHGHECAIVSVSFSLKETRLVSSSVDGMVRQWDIELHVSSDDAIHNVNHSDIARANHRDLGAPSAVAHIYTARLGLASDHLCRAAFSPDHAHATGISALLPPSLHLDPRDAFSLVRDGWLQGPDGELFLWILPEYRRRLWWPRSTAIVGFEPVLLDLSCLAHGEDWAKCLQEDESTQISIQ